MTDNQVSKQIEKAKMYVRQRFTALKLTTVKGWEVATDNKNMFWVYFYTQDYAIESFLFRFADDYKSEPVFLGKW